LCVAYWRREWKLPVSKRFFFVCQRSISVC